MENTRLWKTSKIVICTSNKPLKFIFNEMFPKNYKSNGLDFLDCGNKLSGSAKDRKLEENGTSCSANKSELREYREAGDRRVGVRLLREGGLLQLWREDGQMARHNRVRKDAGRGHQEP